MPCYGPLCIHRCRYFWRPTPKRSISRPVPNWLSQFTPKMANIYVSVQRMCNLASFHSAVMLTTPASDSCCTLPTPLHLIFWEDIWGWPVAAVTARAGARVFNSIRGPCISKQDGSIHLLLICCEWRYSMIKGRRAVINKRSSRAQEQKARTKWWFQIQRNQTGATQASLSYSILKRNLMVEMNYCN